MARALRLGTRASPLALAQSRLVASTLRDHHPGLDVVLVPIGTQGDRDQSTPLTQVQDPDFFSAELDEALLAGLVDFCVHSVKDLAGARPAGIVRAAVPVRENPRDVVVFRHTVMDRLRAGKPLRLGTSSARRQALVADFLPSALPAVGPAPRLACTPLRGAVDRRLARLKLPDDDANALDGVVLALAGLARLWNDAETRRLLEPLLADVRLMVLPLGPCPAAPGQGALAVECRADDHATLARLATLHDTATVDLLARESAAISTLPQALQAAGAATAVGHRTLGAVCFLRGAGPDGTGDEQVAWDVPSPPPAGAVPFDGIAWQRLCRRHYTDPGITWEQRPAVFVSYWHAAEPVTLPADARLWTSGTGSWRKLARRGLWVEGCGDQLGFASLRDTLACPVLGLPAMDQWTVLTYRGAVPGWQESGARRVYATYDIEPPAPGPELAAVEAAAGQATHLYWSSPDQFRALQGALAPGAHHACGAGKTLAVLQAAGVAAAPFPSGREWQQWLEGEA